MHYSLFQALQNHIKQIPAGLPLSTLSITVMIMTFLVIITTPLGGGDADIWFHLAGGRHLLETGELANSRYYSFYYPETEWNAYFWGFQLIVIGIHNLAGEWGLIGLKSILYGLFFLLVFKTLDDKGNRPIALALAALIIAYFSYRPDLVRPHLFSYVFIAYFLYVLEKKPEWKWSLPVVSVAWANIHGVEFVAMLVILGSAYTLSKWSSTKTLLNKNFFVFATAALASLINPYGYELWLTPFAAPYDINFFISELQPLTPGIHINLGDGIQELASSTAFLLTALLVLFFGFRSNASRSSEEWVKLIVLISLSAYLLTKGFRFSWEFLLLTIPLLRGAIPSTSQAINSTAIATFHVIFIYVITSTFWNNISTKPLPFNPQAVPSTSSQYLKENKIIGNCLCDINYGGYYNWQNAPEIKIYQDMQFPPYSALDKLTLSSLLGSSEKLAGFVQKYDIAAITIPSEATNIHPTIIESEKFGLVSIDHKNMLYVRKDFLDEPDVNLNFIDFEDSKKFGVTNEEEKISLIKLTNDSPTSVQLNTMTTHYLFNAQEYEASLEYAETLARLAPNSSEGHVMIARNLDALNLLPEALEQYKKALSKTNASEIREKTVKTAIASIYYHLGDHQKAFEYFTDSINPYRQTEDPKNLFLYAYSAIATGNLDRASMLLAQINILADRETDQDIILKATRLEKDLFDGEFKRSSLLGMLKDLLNIPYSSDPIYRLDNAGA